MKTFSEFKHAMQSRMVNYKPFENERYADEMLETLARGEIKRGVLTMPSQHGKSSRTDYFIAYMIGVNPLVRVICATYSQKLARKHSRAVKDILLSDTFREFFGWEPEFEKDAEDDWKVSWPGGAQGSTFLARSIESPALGETADLLVIDDPLSGGNAAYSPTKQERAWEAIINVLFQRLTPEGMILMIATLWTESDPSLKAMEVWRSSKTSATYLNLAAMNEDGRSSFTVDVVTGKTEYIDTYPVLWPEWRDLAFIEAKRQEMLPEDFETQYQGNPIATGGLASDGCWSVYDELPPLWYASIVVDTGVERGETNDPTLALAMGYGPRGFYVIDAVQGKWRIDQMVDEILALYERVARRLGARETAEYPYLVPLIMIEKASLGRPLHDELSQRFLPFMVQLCDTEGQPKLIRARAQSHHVHAGHVHLPKHSDFGRELKRQWLAFPRGAHDEYVDVVSYALRHKDQVRLVRQILERDHGPYTGSERDLTVELCQGLLNGTLSPELCADVMRGTGGTLSPDLDRADEDDQPEVIGEATLRALRRHR